MPARLLQGRQSYISKQIIILRAEERLRPELLLSRKGRKLSLIGSKTAYSSRNRNTFRITTSNRFKRVGGKPKEDVWDSYKAGIWKLEFDVCSLGKAGFQYW